MSFYTSLSGLKGAQTDLSTVSNNIANVGTVGFKKSRAQFGDIVAASRTTAGQGTRLKKIEQQFSQGGFEASAKELDLAIAGNGFFVTRDGLTGGTTNFTRNGAFQIDAERYLTDTSGGYVQVLPVDQQGNVTGTGLASARNLQLPLTSGTPRATSNIELSIGFPQNADVVTRRPQYQNSPYVFDRLDPNSYNHSTQTVVYDSAGEAIPATLYFVRTAFHDQRGCRERVADLPVRRQRAGQRRSGRGQPDAADAPVRRRGRTMSADRAHSFGSGLPAGASAPLRPDARLRQPSPTSRPVPSRSASLEQDGFATGKLDDVRSARKASSRHLLERHHPGARQARHREFLQPDGPQAARRRALVGDRGQRRCRWSAGAARTASAASSRALERANVDITEELVSLISAPAQLPGQCQGDRNRERHDAGHLQPAELIAVIDPLSPLSLTTRAPWPDNEMPDCFVAAAHEKFILIEDADGDLDLAELLRSAH
jgi:flagellar hook protein FlgE